MFLFLVVDSCLFNIKPTKTIIHLHATSVFRKHLVGLVFEKTERFKNIKNSSKQAYPVLDYRISILSFLAGNAYYYYYYY